MHAKLPGELRDMIYSHLDVHAPIYGHSQSRRPIVAGHFQSRRPIVVGHPVYQPGCAFNDWKEASVGFDFEMHVARRNVDCGHSECCRTGGWLLNPEYVGTRMAGDLARIFFSSNDFVLRHLLLREFLLHDRTRTGMKPYEYLRGSIRVYIPKVSEHEPAWRTTESEKALLNGIHTQLSHLTLLSNGRRPAITIDLWYITSVPLWIDNAEGERRFYNILEAVRAPVYDLVHAGFRVHVKHNATRRDYGGAITIERPRPVSTEPPPLFRMSSEEWEMEKSGHGPGWMPSQHFITKEELKHADEDRREETKRRVRELLKTRWGYRDAWW